MLESKTLPQEIWRAEIKRNNRFQDLCTRGHSERAEAQAFF